MSKKPLPRFKWIEETGQYQAEGLHRPMKRQFTEETIGNSLRDRYCDLLTDNARRLVGRRTTFLEWHRRTQGLVEQLCFEITALNHGGAMEKKEEQARIVAEHDEELQWRLSIATGRLSKLLTALNAGHFGPCFEYNAFVHRAGMLANVW